MHSNRGSALAAAMGLVLSLAACSGAQGTQGPQGAQGATGATGAQGVPGDDGTSTGTISGALTTPNGTGTSPVPGATVSVLPDVKVTATTGADGSYSLAVPIGVYTVVVTKNPGITTTQVTGVSVVAGKTATLNQSVAYSPIALSISSDKTPTSFSAPVGLKAVATGATGPVTYTWTMTSGPYKPAAKPALTASGDSASFTTNTFADMVASNVVVYPKLFLEPRPHFIPISFNQLTQLSYTITVTATDGKYSQTATLKVAPVVTTSGVYAVGANFTAPIGINLVANDPTAATWAWTLTGPAGAPPANLVGDNTQFASFTPTAPGTWTLKNGATTLTVVAGRYIGMGTFVDATADNGARCSTCHAANPPAEFALWKTSAHGNYNFRDKTKPVITMFQQNFASGHYTGECMACHTLGFTVPELFPENEPWIGNGGFADVMKDVDWEIPTVKDTNAWSKLDPNLKALAGVQCENCHGPLSNHMVDLKAYAPQGNFIAGTCLVCHDEPGHHEESAWWVQSPTGHSNVQLAMDEGNNANCGRCHAAQGYAAWRAQVKAGVSGDQSLMIPPNTALNATSNYVASTSAFLTSLGLDKAHVQPQSCEACHDSHMTRLRLPYVSDDPTSNDAWVLKDGGTTGFLPAGFTAQGVGRGALCMTCHNSRVGLHGDGLAPTGGEHGPHTPSQADLLMGQNAYFVSGSYYLSKHALVPDTCVGCHMDNKPASFGTVGGTGVKYGASESSNHTMMADASLCATCHPNATPTLPASDGAPSMMSMLQGQVKTALAGVRAAILAKVNTAIGSGAYSVIVQLSDGTTATLSLTGASNPIAALDISSVHGNKALALTLTNAVTVGGASTKTVTALMSDITVNGVPVIGSVGGSNGQGGTFTDYTTMGKAIWNYSLVSSDGSYGVHNPTFALDVLSATQAKVAALTAIPY